MIPVYERGEYILKLLPPSGWSFDPSHIDLNIDGETDPCTTNQDLNFVFRGFGLAGRVCQILSDLHIVSLRLTHSLPAR